MHDTRHGIVEDLPPGVRSITLLPAPELDALWNSIVIDAEAKQRLVAQAVVNFTVRRKVPRDVLPLHGVILLVGPPGTGKTSLARGLAQRVSATMNGGSFRLLEVDPHALTSSAMGKTQKAVSDLFSQTIAEAASSGPLIVLLDEVETLAADRSRMSLEANPIDIHRATDAVLVQLDALAESHPDILFVATSNFPEAVDAAFTSRCDFVLEVPLPDEEGRTEILRKCLHGLLPFYPAMKGLTVPGTLERCAAAFEGLDGRAIRKVVANALASDAKTALDPGSVTEEQIVQAARAARRTSNAEAAK